MLALDTSSVIAYLSGEEGRDVEQVGDALEQKRALLPPAVLAELLSDPKLPKPVAALLQDIPRLEIHEGYWERVGRLRAALLAKKRRAPLADALIAQSCLDHNVPLITRDQDFRPFARIGGLKLR